MAHKKYIKKNGKKYGPYIYRNYRVNGVTKTEYLGKYSVLKKHKLLASLKLLLILLPLTFLLYNVFAVSVSSVVLNSTSTNSTFDNLTAYPIGAANYTTLIYDWRKDNVSIAVLNVPFDTNVSTADTGAIKDYSSYANNGTLGYGNQTGMPTWNASGISGGAYDFDGDTDFINLSNDSSLDLIGDFTILLWFNSRNWSSANPTFISKRDTFGSMDWQFYYSVSASRIHFYYGNSAANQLLKTLNANPSLNTWHQIVLTREGNNFSLWFNGQYNGSETATDPLPTGDDLKIGMFGVDGSSLSLFNGSIDEVKLYNHSLSAEQILAMYNSGIPRHNLTVSQETDVGENWIVAVTPNNGTQDGATVYSNYLQTWGVPNLSSVVLNSTFYNTSSDNLTAYPINATNYTTLIYDWRVNDTSIALVNMPFDINDTTGARDYSSYAHNGTCGDNTTCPNWTSSGISGGALNLTSDGEGVEIPYSDEFNFTDQITLVAWVKQSATDGNYQSIIRRSCCDASEAPWVDFTLETNATGGFPQFVPKTASGPFIRANGTIALNTWTFLAATYNGTLFSLYVDGVLNNSQTGSGTIPNNSSQSITIGTNSRDSTGSFIGLIDDVLIYNKSLSAEQILAMYNSGAPRHDLIVSQETTLGENWTVAVTPNNITGDGTTIYSNYLEILGLDNPALTSVILNSTSVNSTLDNLTVYPIGATNYTTLVYDWRIDNASIAVLNMPFDTNVSTNISGGVLDYSSYANNGTLGGGNESRMPNWTINGITGGAYEFDGDDDFVNISPSSNLNNLSAFTCTAWIYPKNLTGEVVFIYKDNSSGQGKEYCGQDSSGTGNLYSRIDYSGTDAWARSADDVLTLNTWNFITTTWNFGEVPKLYVNGAPVANSAVNTTPTGTVFDDTLRPLTIGDRQQGGIPFNGTIDDARLYDRVLSAEQILAMYNSGAPRYNLIVSNETNFSDNWSVAITPNNGTDDGATVYSNSLEVWATQNLTSVILNATPYNITLGNLTAYPIGAANYTTLVYDWRIDNASIAVLNMPFDTNVSTNTTGAVLDYSSYSNNGTLGGGNISRVPTWNSSGIRGGAYTFDGVNDYVDMGDVLDISSNLTLMAWIKFDSTPQSQGAIVIGKVKDPTSTQNAYKLEIANDAYARMFIRTSGAVSTTGTTEINDSNWHFIAGTYNGSHIAVFVDGVQENVNNQTGSVNPTSYSLKIGRDGETSGLCGSNYCLFNGSIDEVRIYNRSLSAEQILAMYNSGIPRYNLTVNQETDKGENWSVAVTPNNRSYDGATVYSNYLEVLNVDNPSITSVVLNSTSANTTSDNLTAYPVGATNYTTLIYDWRKENVSLAVLNMPFDVNVSTNTTGAVKDYSSYGNNGTLGEGNQSRLPNWTITGISGGAYSFDGTDDYILLGNDSSLDLVGDFTILLWFNMDDNSSSHYFISKRDTYGGMDWQFFYHGTQKDIQFWYGESSSGGELLKALDVDPSLNVWHQVAVTRSGSNFSLWLDGQYQGSESATTPMSTGDNIRIGTHDNSPSDFFSGLLDGIQLYNNSLSAEQILAMYNSGVPRHNLTVSQETTLGDIWGVAVTPNNGTYDGATIYSNNLTIIPPATPENTTTTTGGGGGVINETTETPETQIEATCETATKNITSGEFSTFTDFCNITEIKEIEVKVNNSVQDVKISIEKYVGKPAGISPKSGKVYKYLKIDVQNVLGKLENAVIKFKVEKSWAESNNVPSDSIFMFKYIEASSSWKELDTDYEDSDTSYYNYKTNLDSFSYFAIAGSEQAVGGLSGGSFFGSIWDFISEKKGKFITTALIMMIFALIVFIFLAIRKERSQASSGSSSRAIYTRWSQKGEKKEKSNPVKETDKTSFLGRLILKMVER